MLASNGTSAHTINQDCRAFPENRQSISVSSQRAVFTYMIPVVIIVRSMQLKTTNKIANPYAGLWLII